ncbi:protein cordon-bleu isoform X2 [Syngnathus typhle]|nr:protein cordon-bleu isoform X2 [Syngnathus typhle]XP_061144030.1 protein cordon-bleu isoform X2 [Syngnathus typhle]
MKARAPPPPAPPRHIFANSLPDAGGTLGMESKENIMRQTVEFQLTLPQGYQTYVTEDGSKPLMDLLVDLCSRYHLNPALHTLELLTPEGHSLGFKPNLLLGSLNVAGVLITEKVCEEKVVRRPAPKVPEKTVRLMVNYHGTQKAVVRVNPLEPLQALIPVICEKCEFDPSCIQLLKDNISRQKLPLDQSLTQLGIKELYVHDQSLVLQPKMASTPALNCSDTIYSSTNSLDRGSKKGLLGFLQLGRRKSKTDSTSLGMDDTNDKIIQNEEQRSALSTVQGVPNKVDQPSTVGSSHSVMNDFRTSPKCDTKKRRAPAPPPGSLTSTRNSLSEGCHMGSVSESQQRKRRAPAPPSSLDSITSYGASPSATPTPDSQASEKHSPGFRTKISESTTISSSSVKRTGKPQSPKIDVQPPSLPTVALSSTSPTPSSSTADSQVLQDSSSELSHSLDSDLDTDDSVSHYSSLTSSNASGSVHNKPFTKRPTTKMKELDEVSSGMGKLESGPALSRISRTERESVLNLTPDEVEKNRDSTMGTTDYPAPPKPRRSPAWENPTLSTPSLEPTESSASQRTMEEEEASQSWLHSINCIGANVQAPETLSLGNSSIDSSLPDQGYAASEGMVDGERSGLVSSPCDIHHTSADGNLYLERSSVSKRERFPGPVRDISSDSDEGCTTWGSNNSCSQSNLQAKLRNINTFEEKYKWLHQMSLEADLSVIRGVPVVDMNVPVTAIDEILEDYKPLVEDKKATTVLAGMKLTDRNDSESASEWRNKNNNAYTAASTTKSSIQNANLYQHGIPLGNRSSGYTKEKKNEDLKDDTQRLSTVKPCNSPEHSKSMISHRSDIVTKTHRLHEDGVVLPQAIQRSLSTEKVDTNSVHQNNSSSNTLPRKVTCNPTSRFGMKTFTVVPPKPSVMQGGTQNASAKLPASAIKIDEQGNIMKSFDHHNRVVDAAESGITRSEECPLVEKAKAFWSCSERQERALPCSSGVTDKAKGSLENIKNTRNAVTPMNTDRREVLKTQHTIMNTAVSAAMSSANEPQAKMGKDVSVYERIKQPQPTLPSDLPAFLKPARRTSSQYVASVINKYTPRTSKKHNIPSAPSQPSSSMQNVAFHSLGHSIQVNPRQSSKISLTDNKLNNTGICHTFPARSMSFPGFVSESQREVREDKEGNHESINGSSRSLGPVSDRIKHFQSSAPTQISLTEHDTRDGKANRCRSPSPSISSYQQSTAKPKTKQAMPEPSRSMSESSVLPGPSRSMSDSDVLPGAPPGNVFGPVKKFKPVVCRSVEKETCLHSNLMEAIQAGGGKDRLRKISSSDARSAKEASPDENERAALLSAIRAQSNTGRLRKTKSGASDELEKFRSASKEDQRPDTSCSPSPIPLTCPSPVFATFPPQSTLAPSPRPMLLHQSKPTTTDPPSALAREAIMEAIRSGSAAERLKKVAVPTKTVQVNGRLGKVHATSPHHPSE